MPTNDDQIDRNALSISDAMREQLRTVAYNEALVRNLVPAEPVEGTAMADHQASLAASLAAAQGAAHRTGSNHIRMFVDGPSTIHSRMMTEESMRDTREVPGTGEVVFDWTRVSGARTWNIAPASEQRAYRPPVLPLEQAKENLTAAKKAYAYAVAHAVTTCNHDTMVQVYRHNDAQYDERVCRACGIREAAPFMATKTDRVLPRMAERDAEPHTTLRIPDAYKTPLHEGTIDLHDLACDLQGVARPERPPEEPAPLNLEGVREAGIAAATGTTVQAAIPRSAARTLALHQWMNDPNSTASAYPSIVDRIRRERTDRQLTPDFARDWGELPEGVLMYLRTIVGGLHDTRIERHVEGPGRGTTVGHTIYVDDQPVEMALYLREGDSVTRTVATLGQRFFHQHRRQPLPTRLLVSERVADALATAVGYEGSGRTLTRYAGHSLSVSNMMGTVIAIRPA